MDDSLKPCPFCGGTATRVDIPADEHDPNAGGSYITCQFCLASSSIVFGDKSRLFDAWNNRRDAASIRTEALMEAAGRVEALVMTNTLGVERSVLPAILAAIVKEE